MHMRENTRTHIEVHTHTHSQTNRHTEKLPKKHIKAKQTTDRPLHYHTSKSTNTKIQPKTYRNKLTHAYIYIYSAYMNVKTYKHT